VTAMDFSKEFKLVVDVSGVSVDAVLLQEGKDKIGLPICYFSKKLNKHQKNYSNIIQIIQSGFNYIWPKIFGL
jgi:hypothetical protein